jgi:hypothetical protein
VTAAYTPDQLAQVPKGVKVTPVYGDARRQVDRNITIEDLSTNCVDMLPQTKVFSDTNGKGPGARTKGELVLAEVKYEVTGFDEDGLPNSYTAHTVYRGEESYSVLMYYAATRTYTDTVEGEGDGAAASYTVVATYEGEEPTGEHAGGSGGGASTDGSDSGASAGGSGNGASAGGSGADGSGGSGSGDGASGDSDAVADPSAAGVLSEVFGSFGDLITSRLAALIGSMSPIGVFALVTIAIGALTLLTLGIYIKRRIRTG